MSGLASGGTLYDASGEIVFGDAEVTIKSTFDVGVDVAAGAPASLPPGGGF